MKRFAIIMLLAFSAVAMFAKSPTLAVEKFFDGRYNSNPEISTTYSRNAVSLFRSMTIAPSQKKAISEISKAVEADKRLATDVIDNWTGGEHQVILSIQRDGGNVAVGLETKKNGGIEIFVSGPSAAFE